MNRSKFTNTVLLLLPLVCFDSQMFAQDWQTSRTPADTQPIVISSADIPPTEPKVEVPLTVPKAEVAPAAAPRNEAWTPEFLKSLPHPPEQPKSLFLEAPVERPYTCEPVVHPYFEHDPLLDAPDLPQPGWFYALDMAVVGPHIFKNLSNDLAVGSRPADHISLPNRGLDWTVAPRMEVGYRLPSGFGGFALSYRTLASTGLSQIFGPDGLANLRSRMDMHVIDLDYESREYTPSDRWTMRWRVGPRLLFLFYESALNQSLASATAGTGILQQNLTNSLVAIGPHASVELTRQLGTPGMALLGRVDVGSIAGRIRQGSAESALDSASPTGVSFGQDHVSSSQTAPMASGLFGLTWKPASTCIDCFVGYQCEYWWNVGRLSLNPASRGELAIQGLVLRVQYNY